MVIYCCGLTGTAEGAAVTVRREVADLEGVLEDMYEKVEELQQVLKEHLSTKNALKVCASILPNISCVEHRAPQNFSIPPPHPQPPLPHHRVPPHPPFSLADVCGSLMC